MKTFEVSFYRSASEAEKRALNFGPVVQKSTMQANSKAQVLKDARIMAKQMDWRLLPEFTKEA
ncbi:MAG: hypothetical protein KGL39_19785 [Patescibacteria group bacterium]|nr:hypothetical protein [Patescibacteria group bacterium]